MRRSRFSEGLISGILQEAEIGDLCRFYAIAGQSRPQARSLQHPLGESVQAAGVVPEDTLLSVRVHIRAPRELSHPVGEVPFGMGEVGGGHDVFRP